MALTFTFGNYTFDPRPFFSLQTSETHKRSNQGNAYTIGKVTLEGKLVGECAGSILSQAQDLYALYNTVKDLKLTNGNGAIIYTMSSGWMSSLSFSETPTNWSRILDYSLVIQDGANGTGILEDAGEPTADGNYTITLDTVPSDSQYGDVYKASVSIGANGLVMNSGDQCIEPNKKARQSIDASLASQIVLNPNGNHPKYSSVFGFLGTEYSFFNIEETIDFDDYTGSYDMNISWIMKDGQDADPYYSDGTVRLTMDKDFAKKIIIDGTFVGLSSGLFSRSVDTVKCSGAIGGGDSYKERYQNAVEGFQGYDPKDTMKSWEDKAKDLMPDDNEWDGGRYFSKNNQSAMNTGLAKSQIGYNPYKGTISYSYEYDDQPEPYVEGAYLESLVFNDKEPYSKIETIQVLGRRQGPIVSWSDIDIELGSSTVTYEGYFSSSRSSALKKYSFKQSTIDAVNTLVYGYGPDTSTNNVTIVEDKQDLNLTNSKITRTITWNYTKCST